MTLKNRSNLYASALCACIAITAIAPLLTSCVSVDVKLSSFMSPDRGPHASTLAPGYTVQDRVLRHGDQSIGITYASHPQSQAIIVFCGGDSFHRSIEGAEALEALAHDADVILFDYPGYGESTGTLTPALILESALAVYDYATNSEAADGKKRIVYGFSLGGLVAAHIAGSRPVDGLVLEATAQNAESWARSRIPWHMKPIITPRIEPALASVDALASLQHFQGHVLLLASDADRKAPATLTSHLHRQLLRAGVHAERVLFDNAAHGAIPHAPGFDSVLHTFVAQLLNDEPKKDGGNSITPSTLPPPSTTEHFSSSSGSDPPHK